MRSQRGGSPHQALRLTLWGKTVLEFQAPVEMKARSLSSVAQGPGSRLRGRGQRRGWASCKRGTGELGEEVVPGAGPLGEGRFDTEDAVAGRSTLSYLITVPQWGLGLRVRAAQALRHQRRQQCPQGRPRAGRRGEASEEQRRSMPGQEAHCPHPPPRNFIAAQLSAAA